MQRILIVNPFGIGDVLFTTPLIHTLKENFPQSFITYLCNYRTEPILEGNPYIDEVISFSRGDIKKLFRKSKTEALKRILSLIKQIRKLKFDLLIDFSLDYRYNIVAKFLGIPKRIGFNYKNRGRFLTDKIDIEGYSDKHIVEYYLDLLKFLGVKPSVNRLELFLSEKDEEWAYFHTGCGSKGGSKGQNDFVVGVVPGGGESWGKTAFYKHWPKEKFAYVSDELIKKYNAKVIILGSVEEKEICKDVVNLMHEKAINTCGETTISQFAALLKRCKLVITNDGGPLHIAVSQDVKTISIFGPVNEKVYGPYPPSEKHIVIKKDLPCRPCYKKFRVPKCNYNHRCLTEISVQEVLAQAEKLI